MAFSGLGKLGKSVMSSARTGGDYLLSHKMARMGLTATGAVGGYMALDSDNPWVQRIGGALGAGAMVAGLGSMSLAGDFGAAIQGYSKKGSGYVGGGRRGLRPGSYAGVNPSPYRQRALTGRGLRPGDYMGVNPAPYRQRALPGPTGPVFEGNGFTMR